MSKISYRSRQQQFVKTYKLKEMVESVERSSLQIIHTVF